MLKNIIHFIKYNNATVLILVFIFLLSGGVFASTDTGQEIIGNKEIKIEGIDNSMLLEINFDNFNMDFKIEKIEEDDLYYYVIYTYLDLIKVNNAWQPEILEKTRKISKKSLIREKKDLGIYLVEELSEEYESRIKELEEEQLKAQEQGEEIRVEITGYSGLIGNTLDLAAKIFPGYKPVKEREIPSPAFVNVVYEGYLDSDSEVELVDIYDNYIASEETIATGTPDVIGTTTPEEVIKTEEETITTTTPEEIIQEEETYD